MTYFKKNTDNLSNYLEMNKICCYFVKNYKTYERLNGR